MQSGVCAWQYANLKGLEMCTRRKGSSQLTFSSSTVYALRMELVTRYMFLYSCTGTASRGFDCLILMPAQDRTVSAVVTESNNIASVLDAGIRI